MWSQAVSTYVRGVPSWMLSGMTRTIPQLWRSPRKPSRGRAARGAGRGGATADPRRESGAARRGCTRRRRRVRPDPRGARGDGDRVFRDEDGPLTSFLRRSILRRPSSPGSSHPDRQRAADRQQAQGRAREVGVLESLGDVPVPLARPDRRLRGGAGVLTLRPCRCYRTLRYRPSSSARPEGEAERFVEDGDNTYRGKYVTNPNRPRDLPLDLPRHLAGIIIESNGERLAWSDEFAV